MLQRRTFLGCWLTAAVGVGLSRIVRSSDESPTSALIDKAMHRAADYLGGKQASDGAWRSEIYGPFKDGPSLTSLIAATFARLKHISNAEVASFKAVQYLASLVSADGLINSGPDGFAYPVYTAAGAVIALDSRPKFVTAQNAWLRTLRNLQLTEDLGWQSSDLAYGGWSYASTGLRPVNGAPATPLAVPNLSATVFALEALREAGVSACDPAIQKARRFVERCQNWTDREADRDARFDDGGFHFILEDPQRNKAGELGSDALGRTRFASYGSATADGLRALIACGVQENHPRRIAAEDWLLQNFSADQHPGNYSRDREHLRPSLYFYYCASVSRALCDSRGAATPLQNIAAALLKRQRQDGSWASSAVDVREDDPLLATSLALQALGHCRNA